MFLQQKVGRFTREVENISKLKMFFLLER